MRLIDKITLKYNINDLKPYPKNWILKTESDLTA